MGVLTFGIVDVAGRVAMEGPRLFFDYRKEANIFGTQDLKYIVTFDLCVWPLEQGPGLVPPHTEA